MKSVHRAIFSCLLFAPLCASAHSGAADMSFMRGLSHPFGGIDHLLAMIAVGVLASRMQGRVRWLLPITFLAAMVFGGAIGAAGVSFPLVEVAIAFSLVVFGAAIAKPRSVSVLAAGVIVGAFAVFHGHAHGTEMTGASLLTYSVGFTLSTAVLHAMGFLLAWRVRDLGERMKALLRWSGAAIAITGMALLSLAV